MRLVDAVSGREQEWFRPDDLVRDVRWAAFSPDCAALAVVHGAYIRFRVWDVAAGKAAKTVPYLPGGRDADAHCCEFSKDGKSLYIGDDNGVAVWDVREGRETKRLRSISNPVLRVAVSADGRLLTASGFKSTLVIDPIADRVLAILPERVAVSPDGKLLASLWSDYIKLWNADSLRTHGYGLPASK